MKVTPNKSLQQTFDLSPNSLPQIGGVRRPLATECSDRGTDKLPKVKRDRPAVDLGHYAVWTGYRGSDPQFASEHGISIRGMKCA